MAIGRSNSWRIICTVIMISFISMASLSHQFDTILPGQSIHYNQTITSRGDIFELGFFSLVNSGKFYVGILYNSIQFTVAWTANKDTPILSSDINDANLILTKEGDLQLQVNGRIIWNTNTTTTDLNTTKAILLDNGNLVVGSDSSPHMWESFNYPTDAWLPGAKIGLDTTTGRTDPIILTAWISPYDLGSGIYSFGRGSNGSSELLVWQNKINTFWSIGALDFTKLIPESLLNITFNVNRTNGVDYVTYHSLDDSNLFRINVHWDGQVRLHIWNENTARWLVIWTKPNVCDKGATCGNNGICSMNQSPVCSCPKDFQPKYSSYLELDDYSGGCIRKNGSQCLKDKDAFTALHNIKQPQDYQSLPIGSAGGCQSACTDNCGCIGYSNASGCYLWYGDLWDMERLYNMADGVTIYLRSGSNELPKKGAKNVLLLTLAPSISLFALVLGFLSCYVYRKKIMKGAKDKGQDLLLFDMEMTDRRNRSQVQRCNDLNRGNRGLDLPIFSLSSVFSATDNFSSSNKLGEGGFGPVYKGNLCSGQEVAVKRLSKQSGQGLEELINEAKLIAKLQHTNLVRLLGCCIQQDEKILIYEYMPNKSLDFFLFDPIKKEMLDWSTRIRIIEGIAQGLLYLHHYSRLRIIHRDLKASNILLDANMKPKISDFGMARIFGGNQLQANTKHIVGTYGYMPPEYALRGLFSIKTDIFSFGVLVLEILSGERNTTFCREDSLNLLGHAWKLWTNDTALELIDLTLRTSCDMCTALRYIHVGLLCVQEHPDDRPSTSDICSMIGNEMKVIEVQPKQPAYLATKALEVQLERLSSNQLTISTLQPR